MTGTILNKLAEHMRQHPLTTTAALRDAGVSARDLLAAEAAGDVIRPIRGIAVTPEVYADPRLDDALICSRTGGVIGMLSAAMRHGLCDALPPQVQVIVPWSDVIRSPAGLPARVYRTRVADALTVGVEVEDFYGLQVRMTSPARTIVDLYRVDAAANRQHAVASLAEYLSRDLPASDLHLIAVHFGAWDQLRPEVEAMNETMNRGMTP